ncbi:MAG: adenine phosphoribosyltransferase [Acidimicrobiales bacterium]
MGPDELRGLVRDVPDHPTPGVIFKDITPLLRDADGFRSAIEGLAEPFARSAVSHVVGIEARGFIVAAPVAHQLGAGFVPVRKAGKLPWRTVSRQYSLEYGTDTLELHVDGVGAGDRVLIIDDVLATGGTAQATAALVASTGATVVGFGFLIELEFLGGRSRLVDHKIASLLRY